MQAVNSIRRAENQAMKMLGLKTKKEYRKLQKKRRRLLREAPTQAEE